MSVDAKLVLIAALSVFLMSAVALLRKGTQMRPAKQKADGTKPRRRSF